MRLKDIFAASKGVLTHAELNLYMGFCAFADARTGECFPAIKTVAETIGMRRDVASRTLSKLVSTGFIRREKDRFLCLIGFDPSLRQVNNSLQEVNSDEKESLQEVNNSLRQVNRSLRQVNSHNKEYLTNQLTNHSTTTSEPAPRATPFERFPLTELFEAFPDIQLTPAQCGMIESEVRETDREAWKATIEIYKGNHNRKLNRYLPEKVSNLLSVFRERRDKMKNERRTQPTGSLRTIDDIQREQREAAQGILPPPKPLPWMQGAGRVIETPSK